MADCAISRPIRTSTRDKARFSLDGSCLKAFVALEYQQAPIWHPGWPTRPQPSKMERLALSVAALAVRWADKSAIVYIWTNTLSQNGHVWLQ